MPPIFKEQGNQNIRQLDRKGSYCWWKESGQPPGMVLKPCKSWDKLPYLNWWTPDFWSINSITRKGFTISIHFGWLGSSIDQCLLADLWGRGITTRQKGISEPSKFAAFVLKIYRFTSKLEQFWGPCFLWEKNKKGLRVIQLEVSMMAGVELPYNQMLVGGFNPFEKYARQIGSFPQVGMNIKNI